MAAIAAAILLVDGRPVLFHQTRLGRGRRPFTILKFRSMRDGEVTAIGRVLRPTSGGGDGRFLRAISGGAFRRD